MRPLGLVLDTVEALSEATIRPEVQEVLGALWERVYAGDKLVDYCIADGSGVQLGPACSVVASSRRGPYPVLVVSPHWRLFVSPEKGRTRIALNAEFIARTTGLDQIIELQRVAAWLFGDAVNTREAWRLSRLDVACDVAGLTVDRFASLENVVMRAAVGTVRYDDSDEDEALDPVNPAVVSRFRRVETVTFGAADSRVQLCAYNKALEACASGKAWQLDAARERGWDGEAPLTRIEFRLRQRGLDEFPELSLRKLSTLATVAEWMPRVWSYLTRFAVRYVTPSLVDSNRSRWSTADWWEDVQAMGSLVAERVRCVTESVREERVRRACRDVVRGTVALVAERGTQTRNALSRLRAVISGESSEPPVLVVVAEALSTFADFVAPYALGALQPDDAASELVARIESRVAYVQWQDSPERAMYRVPARARPRKAPPPGPIQVPKAA